jgi:Secretin and TonB N terminus short domain
MQKLRIVFLFFCYIAFTSIYSQSDIPYLERKVTLNTSGMTISEVFKFVSQQTGVLFSYNPSLFNDARKVNLNVSKMPLRLVLDNLFKGTNQSYKLRKNYIIIYQIMAQKANAVKRIQFTGYIYDGRDSASLENVSVYIKNGKYATLSNEYGYFTVQFSKPDKPSNIFVSVAKENYNDTTIVIDASASKQFKIYLNARQLVSNQISQNNLTTTNDSTQQLFNKDSAVANEQKFIKKWLGFKKFRQNLKNINDTLFSNFSLSLVPIISTNKLLSINTINKSSVNLLIGYSKGTKVAELGGVINIDNGNVKYFQAAGVGNVVTDSVHGLQAAGVFNIVNGYVEGVQLGGIFNVAPKINAIQLAGVFNHSKSVIGLQAAGVYNYNGNHIMGFQLAGLFNSSHSIEGAQIAGLFNTSKQVEGLQLSGLFNVAKKVKGSQISIINIADTVDGIPFGLFSFVRKGYHKLELSSNELLFLNVGFRTGVEKLHNNIFIGLNVIPERSILTAGYGLGTSINMNKKWNFSSDISTQLLYDYKLNEIGLSTINKLFIGVEYKVKKKASIAFGPSLNLLVNDLVNNRNQESINALIPKAIYSSTSSVNNTSTKIWLGFNVSARFF